MHPYVRTSPKNTHRGSEYVFRWSADGDPVDPDSVEWDGYEWRPPAPDRAAGECAYYVGTGGVKVADCTSSKNYICKKGGATC